MRRGSRLLIALATACVLAAVVGVAATQLPLRGHRVVGPLAWKLVAVSADARTLTISYVVPHCTTHPGRPEVREGRRAVEIEIPEVEDSKTLVHVGDAFCTADLRFTDETVRLAAPLGARSLSQPSVPRDHLEAHEVAFGRLGTPECTRLAALPADAPARAVPWVARRVRRCAAPIPSVARALPILRRPRLAGDELPTAFSRDPSAETLVLRPGSARRLRPDLPLWLVPGPAVTCIARVFKGSFAVRPCAPTTPVGRRGHWVPETCVFGTPSSIALVGVVPAGVRQVRLVPRRGRPSVAAVTGGVWTARARYPLHIEYGHVRFGVTGSTRGC